MDVRILIEHIRWQITDYEAQLATLREHLQSLEAEVSKNSFAKPAITISPKGTSSQTWPLHAEEYTRYGRQMILPGVGLPGQLRLRAARILIIGIGGLGCPAAMYLASAGVGTLGMADGDVVELSNLHRQILHSSEKIGMKKVDSAMMALKSINSHPKYITYPEHLDPSTALDIFPSYDLILDCTDAPQTRYLISDAAVLCGKPFVSASALKTDGQLMVLNHPPTPHPQDRNGLLSGPCYRCVFPLPPPAESVVSCGEGGILGPVVGVMGVLMALEAIKLICSGSMKLEKAESLPSPLLASSPEPSLQHSMTMLTASGSGLSTFRSIRLKGKRTDCIACSSNAKIDMEYVKSGFLDYAIFCGAAYPVSVLGKQDRIGAEELSGYMQESKQNSIQTLPNLNGHVTSSDHSVPSCSSQQPIIVDVRDEAQFSICSLPKSINIPWTILQSYKNIHDDTDPLLELKLSLKRNAHANVYTICRLGNDSQLAVRKLEQLNLGKQLSIKDVSGGFKAWKQNVDKDWPEY